LPLWSAEAETSSGGLPGAGGHHPVTETFLDAIGRVTNTVRCVWANGSRDTACTPLETRTEYPYGTSGYAVTTDPLGVQTVTRKSFGSNCEIAETVSAGVTNRVTRYWGGATVEEEFKTDPVSGEALQSCGYRNRERFKNDVFFHLGGLDLYPAQ
ncbi:MAG: hypothetical protein WCU90_15735, partial [Kiritimatiellia bacterium]